ncbi:MULTISPECIES: DUF2380 domain-containing protein [Bradyrhizobium]|jgi:hypothetical protein|uniref:DUF2380 domain-containing protein n=2 Tax=Bradyrhizobium TaxID=374 RepID=A0ABY0Q2S5_9BRAD|nr:MULTISPECIES: DUF2380 domain-containing protein [Bradyrhizobium]SDJ35778.1 Protein of unknown function [Bradyrhizobium ottawaense]SEC65296.1 Protein of unknown function [Bradyrhizobium lablabi]SHK81160.1 Protein of unknown function [Bradyrhizobium lablabi]
MSVTGNSQEARNLQASRLRIGATIAFAICAATGFSSGFESSLAAPPLAVAVADFDYVDTSGEAVDQSAEHRTRVASFAALLRDNIGARGDYRVMPIDCPDHPCTATSMTPDAFVAAARRAGARLVVYGGIRKMSTLVQWGEVQLLDLENEKLLLRRTVTFRGDNDMAYRRAADFVGDTLKDAMPKP